MFQMIQIIATTPFVIQKMIIRFVQPFILGGLVLCWKIISRHFYLLITFYCIVFIIAVMIVFRIYHEYTAYKRTWKQSSVITPILSLAEEVPCIQSEEGKTIDMETVAKFAKQHGPNSFDDNVDMASLESFQLSESDDSNVSSSLSINASFIVQTETNQMSCEKNSSAVSKSSNDSISSLYIFTSTSLSLSSPSISNISCYPLSGDDDYNKNTTSSRLDEISTSSCE
jgi:hypothetical protein